MLALPGLNYTRLQLRPIPGTGLPNLSHVVRYAFSGAFLAHFSTQQRSVNLDQILHQEACFG